ncbi:MAG: DUF937 domain-containing protein [Burkholderiaceae bacterium]
MNILDTLLEAQGGAAARQLGDQFGLDTGQTRSALDALLPSLAGALNQNVQSPGGLESLLGALSGGRHTRYLDEPVALAEPATTEEGNGILGHLFGSKEVSREVASRASQQTGIGSEILKRMLPVVAAMVMSGLSRRAGAGDAATSRAASGAGLATRSASGGGLMDMLTPLLDRYKDGSALDDVLKMASGFLTRR